MLSKMPGMPKIPAHILNLMARMRDTGRIHTGKRKKGKCSMKIYTLAEKQTRYTAEDLVRLRAERGVGNVRKIREI